MTVETFVTADEVYQQLRAGAVLAVNFGDQHSWRLIIGNEAHPIPRTAANRAVNLPGIRKEEDAECRRWRFEPEAS